MGMHVRVGDFYERLGGNGSAGENLIRAMLNSQGTQHHVGDVSAARSAWGGVPLTGRDLDALNGDARAGTESVIRSRTYDNRGRETGTGPSVYDTAAPQGARSVQWLARSYSGTRN